MYLKYIAIIISLFLMACSGGSNQKKAQGAEPLDNEPSDEIVDNFISGQVSNYLTGENLQNIYVSASEQTTVTNAEGRYAFSGNVPEGKLLVTFSGKGMAEYADVLYLDKNTANNILNVSLLPVGTSLSFDPNLPQTLTDSHSSASVSVPANSLIQQDGSSPQGDVTLNLTNINPAQNINLMPGEMIDANAGSNSEPALIESFGAITATFEDSAGNDLNLKQGSVSTIHIPLSDKSDNPPATIPLYYYDKTSGLWVEEGSANLMQDGDNAYYEGEVSHFSTWNADAQFEQVLIHGCIEDIHGKRLSNMNIVAQGNDYSGSANTVSDEQGNFSVPVKTNSSLRVFGFQLGLRTNFIDINAGTSDGQLDHCLLSSGGGITVRMSWKTPPERDYGYWRNDADKNDSLYSVLSEPEHENEEFYWDSLIERGVGTLKEYPFMQMFSDYGTTAGEELLIIVQFSLPGKYRYYVKNELSDYFSFSEGAGSGFYPSRRRISDSRVELNINGNITVFIPPKGESREDVNWNQLPPLTEAPNITWEVFEFVVAEDGSFTVVPLNNWLPQTEWSGQAPPT